MANTLSVMMSNVIRNAVSKKRIRYKENGFNLDLSYINDNIIAMGYPAPDKLEGIYRNRLEDVFKFLEENHHEHYKIYNLCLERSYDIKKFHGRVATYPFEDHNPPTIELIKKFCIDVDSWLKADNQNVVAIHCKAGKGRTGTMICCYLLYSGFQRTAEDALALYDEKRTKDRKGVTIPSQRRYVQYFSTLISSKKPYEKRKLRLCEIRFSETSYLSNNGNVTCIVSVLEDSTSTNKVEAHQLRNWTIDFHKSFILDIRNSTLTIAGDIKIELMQKSSRKPIFHFWFNTYFVPKIAVREGEGADAKLIYTLSKWEIDDAHKDKEHKCFNEDFKVRLVFYDENSFEDLQYLNSDEINNKRKEYCKTSYGSTNDFDLSYNDQPVSSACSTQMENSKTALDINGKIYRRNCDNILQTFSNSQQCLTRNNFKPQLRDQQCDSQNFSKKTHMIILPPIKAQSITKCLLNSTDDTQTRVDLNQRNFNLQPSAVGLCVKASQSNTNPNANLHQCTEHQQNKNDEKDIGHAIPSSNSHFRQSNLYSAKNEIFEEEEDWESGESSAKLLASKVQPPILSPLVPSPSIFTSSFNTADTSNSSNDYSNVPNGINFNHIFETGQCCQNKKSSFNHNEDYFKSQQISKMGINRTKLQEFCGHSLKLNKPTCAKVGGKSPELKELDKTTEHPTIKHCNGVVGTTVPSSKQKLKIKFKKNKLKLSQKLQWIQNYFHSDPVDFCHNFVQQTELRRNSTNSLFNRHKRLLNIASSSNPLITFSEKQKNCSSSYPGTCAYSLKKQLFKSRSYNSLYLYNENTKDFSVDYYSTLCDNQLSFNNSPCKSPRSYVENSVGYKNYLQGNENNDIKKTNINHNIVVVEAKPAKTDSIGFSVACKQLYPKKLIAVENLCPPFEFNALEEELKEVNNLPDVNFELNKNMFEYNKPKINCSANQTTFSPNMSNDRGARVHEDCSELSKCNVPLSLKVPSATKFQVVTGKKVT